MTLASSLQAVQSIGNLGQQLGQGKELWMAPLHPFLLQSIPRVRDFLDQLADVDGGEGESPCFCHSPWPWDLPLLRSFPPQHRDYGPVGQLVSRLTLPGPYCARSQRGAELRPHPPGQCGDVGGHCLLRGGHAIKKYLLRAY